MRIALVSPYSWTYPGGVMRHIEALATQFMATGHEVRILAPYDPDDRGSRLLHRGAAPQPRALPDYVVPLGRTFGIPANGAVSNLAITPSTVNALRTELATGGYDVVHLHEPVAPMVGWDALVAAHGKLPLVGTFHCYSENAISNNIANVLGARRMLNRLHARIAVSDAAAWTGRRFYGGHYTVIPNGVDVAAARAVEPRLRERDELRIAFVGQAVERKGLPLLLRAFEALREHVPARLDIVGVTDDELSPLLIDATGVVAHGKASDEHKWQVLRDADVLCAPSLGGESFGMVLTEGFAAGTPVVASDIAGYRDVVSDGVDGILVPPGDATVLAEALVAFAADPERRKRMGAAAADHAERYDWPHVADEVLQVYEQAIAAAAIEEPTASRRLAVRIGALPSDGLRHSPARRLPTLEPPPAGSKPARPALKALRKAGIGLAALAGLGLSWLALQRIGVQQIGDSLLASSPFWVLFGLALMCSSMVVRAVAWHAILKAALPKARVRLRDAMQGTFIGVLMSATLPARLGEPSRALVVARRTGRPRENVPIVLGTLVSQTLLNIVALIVLGAAMFSTVGIFRGHEGALIVATIAPIVVLLGLFVLPAVLRKTGRERETKLHQWMVQMRGAMTQMRAGLQVFRNPRLGSVATVAQLSAWAVQWLSCYVLLVAFGLDSQAGIGAAAAVLFAVNVTAVLPATPSNLGVFQAACVAVLHGAYGVSAADALGYGIVLQAVEIATAVIMGMPALLKEGLSWREVRLRAMHTSPVVLSESAVSGSRTKRGPYEVEA